MDKDAVALADSLEIELDPVVVVNKIEYPAVKLREPTISQVQRAHAKLDDATQPSIGSQREYQLAFVHEVSRLPVPVVDQLPVRVLNEACDYLEAFVRVDLPELPENPPDQHVVELDTPILANGGEVARVELREPRGGELNKAEALLGRQTPPLPGNVRRYQMRLIQDVSGLNALAVGQLPIRKSREAVRYMELFVNSAPATGKRSA